MQGSRTESLSSPEFRPAQELSLLQSWLPCPTQLYLPQGGTLPTITCHAKGAEASAGGADHNPQHEGGMFTPIDGTAGSPCPPPAPALNTPQYSASGTSHIWMGPSLCQPHLWHRRGFHYGGDSCACPIGWKCASPQLSLRESPRVLSGTMS